MANPRESLNFARKRASFAKAVGAYVPGLTRKSFEKYGFSTATLLTDWAIIAGQELASYTLPERLKWPRGVEAFEETGGDARGRPGATLVLRVDGPRAIEVQYRTAQIIERINAHFGYRAVAEIRFIQAPLTGHRQGRHGGDPRANEIAEQRRRSEAVRAATGQAQVGQVRGGQARGGQDGQAGGGQMDEHTGAPDALLAALDRLHANMTRSRAR